MLPGWQKWKPTYRYGAITALDGDTADVSLDSALSSQQGLNVNQAGVLTGVDIEYMSCDGAAFDVGDEVLIQFSGQDWASPKVIGFKEEPKACAIALKLTKINTNDVSGAIDWQLYLIQPIPTYIDEKGGYTEGFRELGSTRIDGNGVAVFDVESFDYPLNSDYPLYAALSGGLNFSLFTEDIKGDYADIYGYDNYITYWNQGDPDVLYPGITFDFYYDSVRYKINNSDDLSTRIKTTFTAEDGTEYNGWEVEFTDVYGLKELETGSTSFPCEGIEESEEYYNQWKTYFSGDELRTWSCGGGGSTIGGLYSDCWGCSGTVTVTSNLADEGWPGFGILTDRYGNNPVYSGVEWECIASAPLECVQGEESPSGCDFYESPSPCGEYYSERIRSYQMLLLPANRI